MKTKFNLIDLHYLEFKVLNLKFKEMFSFYFLTKSRIDLHDQGESSCIFFVSDP